MGKKNTANTFDIAKAAAIEALKLQKEEERQYIKKNRYHNTELLLKNYLSLVDHFEQSKDKASDIFNLAELDLDLDEDDIMIQSIIRSRMKTMVMISHIEHCLGMLKERMSGRGQPEKYIVIESLYTDKARRDIERGELVKVVAEELHSSEPSIRRWKNEMVRELSILLFGIDGLRLDV